MKGYDPIDTAINWITLLPLWWWLAETVAWLLGGKDRAGELNPWGVLVMLPILGVAMVYGVGMMMLVLIVPAFILVMTPFCMIAGGPSACLDLYMGFWPFS